MASMLVALFRALALRQRLEARGVAEAAAGDLHQRQENAVVDVFAARAQAAFGSRVPIVVRVRLDAGWHAFAPGSPNGQPVELTAAEGSPAALEGLSAPKADAAYRGTFELRAELVVPEGVPSGPRKVPLRLRVQVCADEDGVCLPPVTISLELPIRFDAEDGPRRHPSLFK